MDTTDDLGNYSENSTTTTIKTSGTAPTSGNKDPDVFTQLTGLEGWQGNVLSGVQNSTYHIRFFTISDQPGTIDSATTYKTYDDYVKAIDNANQTTIAESGVTTINISKLNIKTVAASNNLTKTMSATAMTMTVREPMSVSFMDLIADAAAELKIRNLAKVPYFVEVSFRGYSDDGTPMVNPCASFGNKGRWIYRVAIKDISVESDFTGSTYVLNMIPYEENMYQTTEMLLPNSIKAEGNTVGAMLNNVVKQLNQSYIELYGYPLKQYEIKFRTMENYDSTTPVDISNFTLKPLNQDINSVRSYSMSTNTTNDITGHFDRGLTLQKIVELAFANSVEAQNMAKDAPSDKTDSTTDKIRESVIFRFDVMSENVGYDHLTEQYMVKYTLVVAPYYTQRPILSTQQVKVSADNKRQTDNFNKLRKNNFLVKRYDYLFTGLNTEVINFDTKTNLVWSAVLPRLEGFKNSMESETVHAKLNRRDSLSERKKLHESKVDAKNKYDENVRKITDLQADTAANKKEIESRQAQNAELQKVFGNEADLQSEANTLGADIQTFNKQEEAKYVIQRTAEKKYRFAEDVVVEKEDTLTAGTLEAKDGSPVKISILQDTQDSRFLVSGALPDYVTRDRALYGAVLDQIYSPMDRSMQSMNMKINGDPYWLGCANVERTWRILNDTVNGIPAQLKADQANTMPYYPNGDVLTMVTFKYPTGVSDAGTPIIRNNDFFTGVYCVKQIMHDFEGGIFTQRLEMLRMPLINLYKALGYADIQDVQNQNAAKKEVDAAQKNNPVSQSTTTTASTFVQKAQSVTAKAGTLPNINIIR